MAKSLIQDSAFYGFEYYADSRMKRMGEVVMSEERQKRIEDKTCELVNECLDRAIEIVKNNKELAEKYISELKKKYSLTREEIMKIYNKHNKK